MSESSAQPAPRASEERSKDLLEALSDVRARVRAASAANHSPTLVAVSKLKPASDILACYEHDQRDFGENYVQELVEKAAQLPQDIRWHFIGTLQSNKAKMLAAIPNLYAVQTVGSAKAASALEKALPEERAGTPLHVFLQVNTSSEDTKSGLAPLNPESTHGSESSSELVDVARHILTECPKLRLRGLMTIGSLAESVSGSDANRDFACLISTRDALEAALNGNDDLKGKWGDERGRLSLSMGMSADFEPALKAGSDVVRVGTGIFGERKKKGES